MRTEYIHALCTEQSVLRMVSLAIYPNPDRKVGKNANSALPVPSVSVSAEKSGPNGCLGSQ